MERELKEANDFLMNLIESSVDGIIVTDMKRLLKASRISKEGSPEHLSVLWRI
jgi:collagenase-like PrtC family protease